MATPFPPPNKENKHFSSVQHNNKKTWTRLEHDFVLHDYPFVYADILVHIAAICTDIFTCLNSFLAEKLWNVSAPIVMFKKCLELADNSKYYNVL